MEKGLAADNFAMLGLGDIVIPGIFIALLLRYDIRLFVWSCSESVKMCCSITSSNKMM